MTRDVAARLFVASVLAVVAAACGTDETGGSEGVTDERRCSTFVVPQRFGLGWTNMNHRISLWQVGLDRDDPCRASLIDAAYIGGDFTTGEVFTDEAELSFGWQTVVADAADIGIARVRVPLEIPPGGVLSGQWSGDAADLGLTGATEVVAVIEGVRFSTDVPMTDDWPNEYEPRLGYTSRGLGVSVSVVDDSDDVPPGTIAVDWSVRFEHGIAEDVLLRADMNEAIPFAPATGWIDVLLIGVNEAPIRIGDVGYAVAFDEALDFTDERDPRAPIEDRRLDLTGAAGAPRGFYALGAFDLALDPDPTCELNADCERGDTCGDDGLCNRDNGDPGYYVRELVAGVELEAYDASTGEGTFVVDLYASSASEAFAFRPLRYEASATVVWVQVNGATAPSRADHVFAAGPYTGPLQATEAE
jgi:hypothetical protein